MSTCISMHGEYGSHVHTATNAERFVCERCGVLDEDGLLNAVDSAEAELVAARTQLAAEKAAHETSLAKLAVKFSETTWLARNIELDAQLADANKRIEEMTADQPEEEK